MSLAPERVPSAPQATLSAIQSLRMLEGLSSDTMRNSTTDALLAGAVELR
jgi:hypothetical protein